MTKSTSAYKMAAGLALATPLVLFWMIGAVGILGRAGDRADLMYLGVIAVGLLGALIARFRPTGMARALIAMALAQMLVAVIALIAGMHQASYSSVGEILGLNAFFAVLFLASAWLFRKAAPAPTAAGAGAGAGPPR
jgi:hypothetical protein